MLRITATTAALAIATAAYASNVDPIGPFTGDATEGFEGLFNSNNLSVFSGGGALTSAGGLVSGGWQFFSTVAPFEGTRLYGSANGPATLTFTTPVMSFGGYFSTNAVATTTDAPDATANLYNAANDLIGSENITLGLGSSWTWSGWKAAPGHSIKTIEFVGSSLNGLSGGFVQMDSLQASSIPEASLVPVYVLLTGIVGARRRGRCQSSNSSSR